MAGPIYTPPKLYDVTVPDLFTQIAQEYPHRDIVQIIREHPDKPTDSLRITWAAFIQQAQNAAAELRARFASSLDDEELRTQAAQPRKAGAPPVVAGMLGANGYEYYVNLLACSLNRWTVSTLRVRSNFCGAQMMWL
jgi:acyl-CoA synthetase (AMP-forming)/AMP-acid ligase II